MGNELFYLSVVQSLTTSFRGDGAGPGREESTSTVDPRRGTVAPNRPGRFRKTARTLISGALPIETGTSPMIEAQHRPEDMFESWTEHMTSKRFTPSSAMFQSWRLSTMHRQRRET